MCLEKRVEKLENRTKNFEKVVEDTLKRLRSTLGTESLEIMLKGLKEGREDD